MRLPTNRRSVLAGLGAGLLGACTPKDAVSTRFENIAVIDLKSWSLVQVLGAQAEGQAAPGIYRPASTSPAYARITPAGALHEATQALAGAPDVLVNAGFFESYDDATQMAFPLRRSGQWLTGGASPYGPRVEPKHAHYAGVQLHALAWSERGCAVLPLEPGKADDPAFDPFPDAVVSYEWRDHPAVVLSGDPVNRYQLAAVRSSDTILLGTFGGVTLAQAASRMIDEGAVGPVLTMDGGISTCLWHPEAGFRQSPDKPGNAAIGLPHWLAGKARP
jgi:hypothetical protein